VTFHGWRLALIVPLAMGLLMFTQLMKKYAWLSRWPMAVVIGSFSGLALLGNAQGDLLPQIKANLIPFIKPGSWTAFWADPGLFTFLDVLWNPVLIIGVISNILNLMNVQSYYQQIVMGVLIIGAVTLDRLFSRK